MKFISWNVNGLRACIRKGFLEWMHQTDADFIGIQEVRAKSEQLPEEALVVPGWHSHVVAAQKAGYSGVAFYSRQKPLEIITSLGDPAFDAEGRVQIVRFPNLTVANCYFPQGSGKERDNSRVPFKLAFTRRVWETMESFRRETSSMIVMGDFNTAHKTIDLARPIPNQKKSGFLDIEREELQRWIDHGWIDSFRVFEKQGGHYSWWSQRGGARQRNVGWRLDYMFVTAPLKEKMKKAWIEPHVQGSDHCPVGLSLSI